MIFSAGNRNFVFNIFVVAGRIFFDKMVSASLLSLDTLLYIHIYTRYIILWGVS